MVRNGSPPVSPGASFSYALIRVVPRVERGEALNVGVVLYCAARGFLGARATLDPERLRALDAQLDLEDVERHVVALLRVAAGDPLGGPIAELPPAERFHWLSAPRSTIIQPSPPHSGVTNDPVEALSELFHDLVDTGSPTARELVLAPAPSE